MHEDWLLIKQKWISIYLRVPLHYPESKVKLQKIKSVKIEICLSSNPSRFLNNEEWLYFFQVSIKNNNLSEKNFSFRFFFLFLPFSSFLSAFLVNFCKIRLHLPSVAFSKGRRVEVYFERKKNNHFSLWHKKRKACFLHFIVKPFSWFTFDKKDDVLYLKTSVTFTKETVSNK